MQGYKVKTLGVVQWPLHPPEEQKIPVRIPQEGKFLINMYKDYVNVHCY
jgi:hypothetical protein